MWCSATHRAETGILCFLCELSGLLKGSDVAIKGGVHMTGDLLSTDRQVVDRAEARTLAGTPSKYKNFNKTNDWFIMLPLA